MAKEKDDKKLKPVIDVYSAPTERAKALDVFIQQVEKTFGKGSVIRMDDQTVAQVDVIPTGCLSIDMALGIGGLPRGRIVEIFGPESSGKTTLSLHVVAEAQRMGGNVGFVDAEHALDPIYAGKLGVDLSKLYISQPDTGEQGLEIAEAMVRSGAFDVVVVDSVAALTPKVEIDGEMGAAHVGAQARLMSQALRKLAAITNRSKTCIIFINQLREKVGITYGSPEVTPGGKALKFYASIRIDVRRIGSVKEGEAIIGNETKAKIVKNKLAPPFRTAEFEIIYGHGISREGCLIDLALECGIITKSGSWFGYNEERLGQGREKVRALLVSNTDLCREIEAKVREQYCPKISEENNDEDDN